MTMIGLTGGVGSGKSTVAGLLADHGALVIDADVIAREVVAPGQPALEEIAATFGTEVLTPDGHLDRPALAALVFNDETAREALNAITHPRIGARSAELLATAAPGQVIVHDVPLLVENNLAGAYDLVVVVEAEKDVKLARLADRGMPRDEALSRMATQATDEQRREVADVVIANNGDLASLASKIDHLWSEQISPRR